MQAHVDLSNSVRLARVVLHLLLAELEAQGKTNLH